MAALPEEPKKKSESGKLWDWLRDAFKAVDDDYKVLDAKVDGHILRATEEVATLKTEVGNMKDDIRAVRKKPNGALKKALVGSAAGLLVVLITTALAVGSHEARQDNKIGNAEAAAERAKQVAEQNGKELNNLKVQIAQQTGINLLVARQLGVSTEAIDSVMNGNNERPSDTLGLAPDVEKPVHPIATNIKKPAPKDGDGDY